MLGPPDHHRTRTARARAQIDGYRRYLHASVSAAPAPFIEIFSRIGPDYGANAAQVERTLSEYPNANTAEVVIDSPGGSIDEARKIYTLLRSFRGHVSARVVGRCCSAATIVLLAAAWREAGRDAAFLLHESETNPRLIKDFRWNAQQHEAVAADLRTWNSQLISFYGLRTGLGRSIFAEAVRNELPLSAQSALKLRLIHSIIGVEPLAPIALWR